LSALEILFRNGSGALASADACANLDLHPQPAGERCPLQYQREPVTGADNGGHVGNSALTKRASVPAVAAATAHPHGAGRAARLWVAPTCQPTRKHTSTRSLCSSTSARAKPWALTHQRINFMLVLHRPVESARPSTWPATPEPRRREPDPGRCVRPLNETPARPGVAPATAASTRPAGPGMPGARGSCRSPPGPRGWR